MEELKQEQMQEQEENVEEKQATTSEEKPVKTYTQEEVEQIKKNAIAEGMRKASKNQEIQNNEELDKLNASLNEKQLQMDEMQKELTAIKQVNKMNDLGIDKKYQEDVIALIKGKGLEVNEDTIVEMCEKHPEWKLEQDNGIGTMGMPRQDSNPYEEAKIKEEQEVKDRFRL